MTSTRPAADRTRARHPIAVVAARTGLSQDVIRAWERRYGVVAPGRSPAGRRLYSDADVERLRLLRAASAEGRRVADLARESTEVLERLAAEGEAAARTERRIDVRTVDEAMDVIGRFDGPALAALLRRSAADYGVVHFLDGVVAPLLRRIGDAWHAGRLTIAEEHFASAIVEDVVRETTRALAEGADGPVAIVATLAGNRHGMGAALAASVVAAAGWTVVHLGEDMPSAEIVATAERRGAGAVAISVVYTDDLARTVAALRDLRARLPARTRLVVGGRALATRARSLSADGIDVLESLEALRDWLRVSSDPARPSPS